MNDSRPIAAALLLSGFLLTTTVGAQVPGDIVKPVPVDPTSTRQVDPVPTDDDPDVRPIDRDEDPGTGGSCGTTDVQMIGDGNTIRVLGGTPGNRVAILIGLEQAHIPLPGGAVLRINPLMILTLGAFDETGQYAYELKYEGDPIDPVSVFAQAITMLGDSTTFATSGVIAIDFDGVGVFDMRPVFLVSAPAWVMPAQHAWRRGMLA